MKRITWPKPETIGAELASPLMVAETMVLCREDVRSKAKVGVALDIYAKLEADPIPDLTDEEAELLTAAMVRPGEKVTPPAFNRYVLRVLRALHFAETVETAGKA